jgi:D-serine deaminase-like pyridoxal phosphate-dependent protein
MNKIFGAVLALGIVSGAVAVWSQNALRTTQATIAGAAEASVAGVSTYELHIKHGKDLPVENWSPAF